LYAYYMSTHNKIQDTIMGNNVPQLKNTPHVDRLEQERELGELLDGDKPIIIYGNHEVGKTDLLNSVLCGREGVVYVSMIGPDHAEKMLMVELGAENIRDVKANMRAARSKLGKLPIVVFDIPRNQEDINVIKSVSNFAKVWDVDFNFARVVIMVSATGTAMVVHAEGREKRYWVGPLSEKDMESSQAPWVVGFGGGESQLLLGLACHWSHWSGMQVDVFLAKHSGGKAGQYKKEIYELTGGNIGRMKAGPKHVWDMSEVVRTSKGTKKSHGIFSDYLWSLIVWCETNPWTRYPGSGEDARERGLAAGAIPSLDGPVQFHVAVLLPGEDGPSVPAARQRSC
jgi:hypothetical protein